jgi:hypothetical protein
MLNETQIQKETEINEIPLEIINNGDHVIMKYIELSRNIKDVTFDEVMLIIGKRLLVRGRNDVVEARKEENRLIEKGKLKYEENKVIINDVGLRNFLIVYLLQRLHGVSWKKAYDITVRIYSYLDVIVDLLTIKCPVNDYYELRIGNEVELTDKCKEKLKAIYGVIKAIHKALTS